MDEGKKQVEAVKVLKSDTQQLSIKDEIPEDLLSEKLKMNLRNLRKLKKWRRKNLIYERSNII